MIGMDDLNDLKGWKATGKEEGEEEWGRKGRNDRSRNLLFVRRSIFTLSHDWMEKISNVLPVTACFTCFTSPGKETSTVDIIS